MKRVIILALLIQPALSQSQALINKWLVNTTGQKASYWQNAGNLQAPSFSYSVTSDSADVLQLCYNADSVWVRSEGMTFNMGKYLNPGGVLPQNYTFRFPRNPTVTNTKVISPKTGAIGMLVNGVPIYGLSNSFSWSSATNTNSPGPQGQQIWNVEVYKSEGFVLDTAFGAHPQQQGAYHSHATPYRLYKNTPVTQHSPLVGFAFDGYPVYGPYAYSTPTNAASAVTRMKSGYSLRNTINRHMLPDGTALNASQYGPAISTQYPIGFYCEDYEWLASNAGDLDEYNGRYCVTPDYPNGTYAYFVTVDASGVPAFPYYIGINYYGQPDNADLIAPPATSTTVKFPVSGTTCRTVTNLNQYKINKYELSVFPNPSNGSFWIKANDFFDHFEKVVVSSAEGRIITSSVMDNGTALINMGDAESGIYFAMIYGSDGSLLGIEKLIKH